MNYSFRPLVLLVPFTVLFAGCANDNVVGGDAGPRAPDTGTIAPTDSGPLGTDANFPPFDAGPRNPPNPDGLGPAPIALGDATDLAAPASYVILAKTGITNVTGSSITGGHVALSPAAASNITGFSLVADPSNVFATSSAVVAPFHVYAADYAPPTPIDLTTAVHGMENAYVDGAGRTSPDFLDLSSGHLGGLTLAPGLYTWGSSVTIPANVTIEGAANDVWIFQVANDLDMSAGQSVLLSRGAHARNVFWVVAGEVIVHANAHLEGVVICSTQITLQTNASLHGRALAQTLVALDDNAITAP